MRFVNVYGVTEDLEQQGPTVQGAFLSYNGISLTWDRGIGDGCIVIISGLPITFKPFRNTTYRKNQLLGGQQKVAYRGTGNSVEIYLIPGRLYYAQVFEFNGRASSEVYNITGDQESILTPTDFGFMLQENGDFVLQENGFKIIV